MTKPLIGISLTVNLYDILNDNLLHSVWYVRPILINILEKINLQVIDDASNQFDKNGFNMALIMPESNLTIYTYPKLKTCYIHIFSCNEQFNSQMFLKLLKDAFDTDNITYNIICR